VEIRVAIEYIAIKQLKLLDNNPRKIDKVQFDKLKKSLRDDPKFFDCRPCLVNVESDGVKRVYAGNQRVQAAKKLGWKEVPCIVEYQIDDEVIQQRIIKDNKHYGVFDDDLLHSLYDIDTLLDAGFTNQELTGDYGIEEITSGNDEDEKDKKMKTCPSCGHEF
jgi:ParB-like chromosome segregation protein Spo0J